MAWFACAGSCQLCQLILNGIRAQFHVGDGLDRPCVTDTAVIDPMIRDSIRSFDGSGEKYFVLFGTDIHKRYKAKQASCFQRLYPKEFQKRAQVLEVKMMGCGTKEE